MTAAASQTNGKTNGAHGPAAHAPAPHAVVDLLVGWIRSELDRCGQKIDGFELVRVVAMRDVLIQPYRTPDAKGVEALARELFERAQYEANQESSTGTTFAVVALPDRSRLSIGAAKEAPPATDDPVRRAMVQMHETSTRHSIDLTEVTRDMFGAFGDQRTSEQAGFKVILAAAQTLYGQLIEGFVKSCDAKDKTIAALTAERQRLIEADMAFAQREREQLADKSAIELEAKNEERRFQTRSQLIEEFAPIVRGKFLAVAVEKGFITKDLANSIMAAAAAKKAASPSPSAAAGARSLTDEQVENIRALLQGLSEAEMSKVYDALGPESLARLQLVLAAWPT